MSYKRNKKVLITGGSRGIGAEAVKAFASKGATVAFFYNKSQDEAYELSRKTGALAIKCNVGSYESVKNAMDVVREYFEGEIDVLINNAGIADFNLVTHIGALRWKEMIDVNLNGAYYCASEVLPMMIDAKSGSIINVSSMWGQVGASCEVAYSTAKAGLIGFTKALAKEVGPSGIRVNCIAPGMIDTDMNSNVSEEATQEIIDETPMSRIGKPEDVAALMEFLASSKSSYITGQVIGVNGGLVV